MTKRLLDDPFWYKKAVFYELYVRGFYDSNNDGKGDLKGVCEKLSYLEWLGIDCIWLLPFYKSPLRDGGYDVSDFYSVHEDYGTVDDLIELVEKAHALGIRVIADLVLNHTSEEHPWFQSSRSDPNGPYGDYYIWSDDDSKFKEARIIFTDVEKSNWTWDPVRRQYYFHRFYSHQPDLNYENELVVEEMLNIAKFWLDTGIDGFRLDAVPYLYKREGTTCESLPETHKFLKRLRSEIDARYLNRILLAEANQWPADVVDYFGNGDECHMCFHFPLMPRMFMAATREQGLPITEILTQTPDIPESCQWGLFLRNHDELTLEMVNDEERDFMHKEYVKDPLMKRNMGIVRRLAPLIDNSRKLAELLYAILFSLAGSPILYYGDEILMGDNIYLKDRDTVRTPMHWSPDRNAGFSKADFFQIYLPPLMDAVYGFQVNNVESQLKNPSSFLHWLKRMISIREHYEVFGTGKMRILLTDNPSVFAVLREANYNDEKPGENELGEQKEDTILCAFNLSRFPQPATIELPGVLKRRVVDIIGRVPFLHVENERYFLTFNGYGFYWLSLLN